MKKLFLAVVLVLAMAGMVQAASWSVTVSWTRSVGPNLASEEVFYNNASKCSVLPAASTTCNFIIPDLTGDIWVRSFNSQGAFADSTHFVVSPAPAASSGVVVTITYVP